ncbi:MAG: 6-phosphogluconolactonase [Chloroflexota bacterium]|nr:6-phosphogluconolactonase [Chloroflexota bacterium]
MRDQSTAAIPGHGEVQVVADAEALARAAAAAFVRVTTVAVTECGRAYVALSGGSTPKRMGELLASAPYRDQVPWGQVEVFWGDERWVPESSPESNAGVAKRTFLDRVPIAPDRVHPFPTAGDDPSAAAAAYEATLRDVFAQPNGVPVFDLILLGMGDDGHTASLFPRSPALREGRALAAANPLPQQQTVRLTLTYPVLNAGREVVCLVGGGGKAETLAAVLEGPSRPDELPAQRIQPVSGRLTWLVDAAAAARLTRAGATSA